MPSVRAQCDPAGLCQGRRCWVQSCLPRPPHDPGAKRKCQCQILWPPFLMVNGFSVRRSAWELGLSKWTTSKHCLCKSRWRDADVVAAAAAVPCVCAALLGLPWPSRVSSGRQPSADLGPKHSLVLSSSELGDASCRATLPWYLEAFLGPGTASPPEEWDRCCHVSACFPCLLCWCLSHVGAASGRLLELTGLLVFRTL